MTPQRANRLLLLSLYVAVGGLCLGFSLGFAPGWANGWPGLPQRVVWPVGMTTVAVVVGAAPVIGLSAALSARLGGGRRSPWALGLGVAVGLSLVALTACRLYQHL